MWCIMVLYMVTECCRSRTVKLGWLFFFSGTENVFFFGHKMYNMLS